MNQIKKIVIYLMLFVLLTAEDCGFNSGEPMQTVSAEVQMFQELEANFISDEMNEAQLDAMEERAVQKVHELVDYLNIYADSGLNLEFRKQAWNMISKLFVSGQDLQEFLSLLDLEEDVEKVELSKLDGDKLTFKVEFIGIDEPFKYAEPYYTGQVNTRLVSSNEVAINQLGVRAMKISKTFGNEKLEVWEMFLSIKDK